MSISTSTLSKARLLRRAQLVARTQHPNLVHLLPLPGGAGLAPVLTGLQRLADFDRSELPFRFELEHSVQLLLDVLNGLSALHDLDFEGAAFVHGAVSPRYICVDGHGSACLIPLVSSHVMQTFSLEASGYVAPEWLSGGAVDCRADIFSVGVLLWEALARCRLFPDPSPAAIMSRLASGALPRLTPPAGAEWAKALCEVAERAIAADPGDRYPTARAFSGAIVAAAGPRLTRRLGDSWQEEAPTLVPARGSYVPPRRSWTPPGVAIDLSPEPPSPEPAPPPLPARASVPPPRRASVPPPRRASVPPPLSVEPSQLARSGRGLAEKRLRAAVLGLGALSFLAAAWLLRPPRASLVAALPAAAPPAVALAPRQQPTPASVASAAAAAALRLPAPASPAAASPAASATALPLAAPPIVAAPRARSESSPAAPAAPHVDQASKPARASKSRALPSDSDYGI